MKEKSMPDLFSPHFSHRLTAGTVAYALVRAASPLMATPGVYTVSEIGAGVEMSLDTARTSAYATTGRIPVRNAGQ